MQLPLQARRPGTCWDAPVIIRRVTTPPSRAVRGKIYEPPQDFGVPPITRAFFCRGLVRRSLVGFPGTPRVVGALASSRARPSALDPVLHIGGGVVMAPAAGEIPTKGLPAADGRKAAGQRWAGPHGCADTQARDWVRRIQDAAAGNTKGGGVVGPVTQRDPVSLRRINPRAVHAPDVHWARARSDAGMMRYARLDGRRRICETVSG
jgi:hypothetical protein